MRIYYLNNFGQSIDFMAWPYRISESDLFDYEWSYESKNSINPRISRFYRELTEKSLKISVAAASSNQYSQALQKLLEVTERDVMGLKPGKLYVGDSYLSCYICKSEKSDWVPGVEFLVNTFTAVSEGCFWVKENRMTFHAEGGESGNEQRNLDFPVDYPYDFSSGMTDRTMVNTGFHEADFEITIYGKCQNPEVHIAGHKYGVACQLEEGEYLKVNSITKKIFKMKANGEQINQFHLRDREAYIFQKIPAGKNAVTWNGQFGFDVTLLEERSEPQWI